MSKKRNTTKDKVVEGQIVDEPLLPFNPLMTSPVMSINEESEIKNELIEEVQSIAVLNKEVLDAKRKQVEMEVDNKKLDAANKIIDGINLLSDKALDPILISKMIGEDLTPLEYKMVIESIQKLSMTLKDVLNPSVADEYGNRKRTKIVAQFQSPSGEKTTLGVEMND